MLYGMILIDKIKYTYIRSKELVPLALIKYDSNIYNIYL